MIDFCHASRGNRGARGHGRVYRYSRIVPTRQRRNRASRIAVLHGSGGTNYPQFNESRRNQFRYNTWRGIAANANGDSDSTLVLVCPSGSLTGSHPLLARPPKLSGYPRAALAVWLAGRCFDGRKFSRSWLGRNGYEGTTIAKSLGACHGELRSPT